MWNKCKLQALGYDILPLEEGAGKPCSECGINFLMLPAFYSKKVRAQELWKVEVAFLGFLAFLGSPSLIRLMVSVDTETQQH